MFLVFMIIRKIILTIVIKINKVKMCKNLIDKIVVSMGWE